MKLRNKVTVILVSLWLVMVAICYLGSHYILGNSYLDLERKQAVDNLQRFNEAVDQMIESVSTMTASWSVWDDTYQFVIDKNQNYIKSNLAMGSASSTNMDMILYYDAAGKFITGVSISPDKTNFIEIPKVVTDYLTPDSKIIHQPSIDSASKGLLLTDDGILMMAGRPILTSNSQGPSHGTLVMAKYISSDIINKLKNLTKLNFTLYDMNHSSLDEKHENIMRVLNDGMSFYHENISADKMTIYSLIRDINGLPISLASIEMPRTIKQFGNHTIKYFNVMFFIYSSISIILLWYLLQNLLVKRLETLKGHLGNVDQDSNYFNNLIAVGTDEVSAVASLYHQATHDPLTGLANRNLLEQAFDYHVKNLQPGKDKIAVLFLDVDHFKHVNDSMGHEIGDLMLIDMAEKLTQCLRENDIAVRMGGDEFVVMLVGIDIQQLNSIIDRIYKLFSQSININEHELYLESSMGISIYPNDGDNISVLLKKSDIALYHAKESGRNHYQYYSEELNKTIQESYKNEAELQRAIDNKELFLVYQPVVDVLSHKIVGIEALLRWCHPQRGLLAASEIIPIAEKSGLIVPIGKWVLTTACQQIRRWQDRSLPVVPVTVNISLSQTKSASIYKLINNILADTRLDPQLLELELTEISYGGLDETILNDLDQLKDLGVKLVVDDFGIGSAGMAFLRRLPVSKIKIDRSFIKDIHRDPDDCAITLAIIAIAHQLDLQVIAEGVETREQYEFLKLNHVDAAQGNYFSKPVYADDCEMLLKHLEPEKTE